MTSLRDALRAYQTSLHRRHGGDGTGGAGGGAGHDNGGAPHAADSDVCPHCGGAGYVRRDVPVGDPNFGQPLLCVCKEQELDERRRREDERRRHELDRFFSLQPFSEKTFETFDPGLPGMREPFEAARAYAENPNGWLVLMGGYGTGKTHLAAAIAHRRLAAGTSVYFAVVTELLDHLRAAFAPASQVTYDEMFDKIREVELLVLDDLGAENSTAWATEKLFQLINYRYNLRIPTVITTNNQLHAHMDPRLRSRLSDLSLVQNITMKAQDHRPRNTRRPPRW